MSETNLRSRVGSGYHHMPLEYYRLDETVPHPVYATDGSACFDLHAHIPDYTEVNYNNKTIKVIDRELILRPWERVLVPTGLIFNIRECWSVRLHSRSGLAFKQGLTLANGEGIIDSDYVEPVYVCLMNVSGDTQIIKNGDRICQAEMVQIPWYDLKEIDERPSHKTTREGGFGSTGKTSIA